jgi:predicted transcriptional regulator
MAKTKEKNVATSLRRKGMSIKDISKTLHVSRSSVSVWCSNILLTKKQEESLREKMISAGHKGRLLGAEKQKKKREEIIQKYKEEGLKNIQDIDSRDLLMIGIGLYLGEGNKTGNKFQFTNSNPDIICIMLLWLTKIFKIKKSHIVLNVLINGIHVKRELRVRRFWSQITNIPEKQFNKTIFIKSKNKKMYENFSNHFGTLVIRVRKSSLLQYKILGLCHASIKNTI